MFDVSVRLTIVARKKKKHDLGPHPVLTGYVYHLAYIVINIC